MSRALSIFTYKVSIIRAFVKQAGILGFQLIILSLGLLVVIEKGPRLTIESQHDQWHLDLECPLARLPHSSYAYRSPGHRHLPGGPDLANAILLQFLARVNK